MKTGRCFIASLLAVSLLPAGVHAAGVQAGAGLLPPGKPAGINEAQVNRGAVLVVGASILLIGGFSVLIAGAQNDNITDMVIAGGTSSSALVSNNVATSTATTTP